ncbi:Transducin beta-like protein 3 [Babesia sp. Xinjiang]|uniref:Transducin beta-like protein 3 n=1 Tax=Babesia sp. Xinjiang TaxID=462227 RepID=UPI000A24EFCA|nr:Transducin beta-like protein 3 [Babesia sp. Xinjiang]XP_028871488.1 Transducin beta-like protein 3 [Babesia sp. Xinjiang]ORM40922.1 Transducin beta-like protein 3 [Babesia sp. Xinjiang]ORM41032.1 Transducin beta-like protein 3 [Babesia sp. Xinjiang]
MGEGKDVARDYFQRISVADRTAVCLLDAKEDDLYTESTWGPNCIYVAGGIAAYAVDSSGDTLALALCSGLLTFYGITSRGRSISLERGQEIKTNTKNVTQMCFDSSGEYLACGTVDGTVAVFHKGAHLKAFHHQEGQISVLRFYPKSLRLLAGSQNGEIVMYCLNKKVPIATFQDHLSYVQDIAFLISEDDTQAGFVSCARDSYICFWSLDLKKKDVKEATKSGNLLVKKPFKRITQFESVLAVSVVNQGLRHKGTAPWALFIATESGTLSFIDPITEKVIMQRTIVYGQGDELKHVTVSKNSNEIVVLGASGSLCFYSLDLELKHQLLGNIDGAYQILFFQGTHTIDISEFLERESDRCLVGQSSTLVAHSQTKATAKKVATQQSSKTSKKGSTKRTRKDDDAMDVDGSDDGNVNVAPSSYSNPGSHAEDTNHSAVFNHKRDWLHSMEWLNQQITKGIPVIFILCGDDVIRMLALDGWGSCISLGLANEKHRHEDTVLSIAYSHTGNILASGGKDEQVLIWDLKTLTVVTKVILDGLNVACIAFPGGISAASAHFRMLATGNNVLKSFDIPTTWVASTKTLSAAAAYKPQTITNGTATAVRHKKPINAIAFSPNKKIIASAGSDKIIVIYAAENLIVKGECIGHRRSVVSVAFTSVNKTVVSASVDMTIKIWNLNDFSCVKTLQGHTKAVMRVVVLHNDLQLLSVGMDGLVKLWNIKTSDCIFTADNHSDKVWNAELFGQNLLTVSGNGVLIWWDDISAELQAKKMLEERDEELKQTQMESLDADGRHSEALCLSMELRKPSMASKILNRRCATQLFRVEKEGMIRDDMFKSWVSHMKKLPDIKTKLTIALDFVQLWISRASTSWMGNCLLAELIAQFTPAELFVVEGMANRIDSILSHQSSHLTRFLNLSEKSHLLDVLLGYNKLEGTKPTGQSLTYEVLYK